MTINISVVNLSNNYVCSIFAENVICNCGPYIYDTPGYFNSYSGNLALVMIPPPRQMEAILLIPIELVLSAANKFFGVQWSLEYR